MRYGLLLVVLTLVGCSPVASITEHTSDAVLVPMIRADLSENIPESSGLAYRLGRFWTINDGGNAPDLFWLDESGQQGRIPIVNAANLDWETLTTTPEYLVVGDCGNNRGDRIWFQLHRVKWTSLKRRLLDAQSVTSHSINVKLDDVVPAVERQRHNRDCEAMVTVGDKIWLFTKNWNDQRSRLYVIDPNKDEQALLTRAVFETGGLITGADFDPATQRLALIGYGSGLSVTQPFIWIVPVINDSPEFTQAVRYKLGKLGQWEAVLWHNGTLWVSRETSVLGDAALAEIELPVDFKTNN